MFDLIMRYLLVLSYAVCSIGFIVALGSTIYAVCKERINILEALVFFAMVFTRWPEIMYDHITDEIKWWWTEHIDLRREER